MMHTGGGTVPLGIRASWKGDRARGTTAMQPPPCWSPSNVASSGLAIVPFALELLCCEPYTTASRTVPVAGSTRATDPAAGEIA